jgi:hypothetical protein
LESRNSEDLKKPNHGCENLSEEKFYLSQTLQNTKQYLKNSIKNKKPITKARKDENTKKELGGKDVS